MPYKDLETRRAYYREYIKRWNKTTQGIIYSKRCNASPKRRAYRKLWEQTPKRKVYMRLWRKSPRWKIYRKRWMIKRRAELKAELFLLLGDKCAHCGFSDKRALQIDHINNGGCKEYKTIGSIGVLRRAVKEPHQFQILCANCNWIKAWNVKTAKLDI